MLVFTVGCFVYVARCLIHTIFSQDIDTPLRRKRLKLSRLITFRASLERTH